MPDGQTRREVLRELEDDIVAQAGGYLRPTLRRAGVTCSVCTAPLDSSGPRCTRCRGHHDRWAGRLTDRCGFVTYAVRSAQSGRLMRNYKASPPVLEAVEVVQSLLAVALQAHGDCPRALSGRAVTHWCTVPSAHRGPRTTPHPLRTLVGGVARRPGLDMTAADLAEGQRGREVVPQRFVLEQSLGADDHVLVVEDVWTSGANTQSAALAVRAAGAGQVSALVVGRWLDLTYPPTQAVWESDIRDAAYRAGLCPWTGGACPPGSSGLTG